MLECGIEIVARPPGKEACSISLLSGGEKTLTCVALLLAVFRSKPSPFCVLDEVDAALDEANIGRFIGVLREFLSFTQFIVVTHSKKTMSGADTLYGVTMEESGVSKRVSVRFEDVSEDGHISPAALFRSEACQQCCRGSSDAGDDAARRARLKLRLRMSAHCRRACNRNAGTAPSLFVVAYPVDRYAGQKRRNPFCRQDYRNFLKFVGRSYRN